MKISLSIIKVKIKDFRKSILSAGFTLVETLVAISILLMAVIAPMVFISGNISSIFQIKDKITALYLNEDAIDFVKYRIATNFNKSEYWLNTVPDSGINCASGCMVDSFSDTISLCSGICPAINFDSTTGVYGYTTGSPSKFTRTVTIAGIPVAQDPATRLGSTVLPPQEIIITSRIIWTHKGATKQSEISEHAFSWGI